MPWWEKLVTTVDYSRWEPFWVKRAREQAELDAMPPLELKPEWPGYDPDALVLEDEEQ